MNFIKQKLVSLRHRARDLQTNLRRWSLYDDAVSRELREDLLARMTPAEETTFETDLELTKTRLRPVSVQLRTILRWYDYVLENINEQIARAREFHDHGRQAECLAVLNDIEVRMLAPNEHTLAFLFRTLQQHTSHEHHQKLATIDAIIRDLYLPTMKQAHQRGIVPKETLSRTPVAYLTDVYDVGYDWHRHCQESISFGRVLPISLLPVSRRFVSEPWNLIGLAFQVGQAIYADLGLGWELANKLQNETVNAGVQSQSTVVWSRWHEVLFADVFGVLKLGPAYISGMVELLGADPTTVMTQPDPATPPAYIRWHVMLQTLQLLNLNQPAIDLFNNIHKLCGDPNQLAQRHGPQWLQLVNECRAIAGVIAFTPWQRLGGARIVDIVQVFQQDEQNFALKVKDLLLAGDETCSSDASFSWVEPISDKPPATHIALSGVRLAFDVTSDFETAQRMWIRFWCLQQYLAGAQDSTREREDREFAPGDAVLKTIALHAMPAASIVRQPVGVMVGT